MSSLLNKLKGHGHHPDQAYPSESYEQPTSNTGYDNTQSGYGQTNSPTHRGDSNYENTPNTSGGYDNGPLNSHSDGGRYHAPKGTHVGPNNSSLSNKADSTADSGQSELQRDNNQGYGEPGYDQSNYGNNRPGYDNSRSGYGNDRSGYGTTTTTTTNTSTSVGHGQYGTTYGNTQDTNKRLPEHPTTKERLDPRYDTENSQRPGNYGDSGYDNSAGSNNDGANHDSNKRLPADPDHPTLSERLNKNVDTSSSRRNEHDNAGYGSTGLANTDPRSSNIDSRHHGHDDQFAARDAGAHDPSEFSRHQSHPVRNDDSMMNRSHPVTRMHPSDRRYDSNRTDQTTGADGEYLPGPAPNTAGPHKSDMLSNSPPEVPGTCEHLLTQFLDKLDPRVDSDRSKLEKEREREGYGDEARHHNTESGYGKTGSSEATYGNEHERRINEGHHSHHHEGGGAGADGIDRRDQYTSNSPNTNRDSGYGGPGSTTSNLTHRKPVNETGTYGNDQYSRGSDYDRSNPAGTYNNPAAASQGTYDNDENDFECAKCGHKNTHLRKNKTDRYGNKPSAMDRLNPRTDATGDGQAGFMK